MRIEIDKVNLKGIDMEINGDGVMEIPEEDVVNTIDTLRLGLRLGAKVAGENTAGQIKAVFSKISKELIDNFIKSGEVEQPA